MTTLPLVPDSFNILDGSQNNLNCIGFVDVEWVRHRASLAGGKFEDSGIKAALLHQDLKARSRSSNYLRTYLYDAEYHDHGHANAEAQRNYLDDLDDTPGIQLRRGYLMDRRSLEQKAVDTLLVLDLLTLAHRNAYHTALLVAGDRDFAEAVREVQRNGKRVILVVPEKAPVAQELRRLADDIQKWDLAQLAQLLSGPAPPPPPPPRDR